MNNTNENNSNELLDILGAIEVPDSLNTRKNNLEKKKEAVLETKLEPSISISEEIKLTTHLEASQEVEEKPKEIDLLKNEVVEAEEIEQSPIINPIAEKKEKDSLLKILRHSRIFSVGVFGTKYILTSVLIFSVLLLSTNYSAYLNIAKSYIYEDEIKNQGELLLNSVSADDVEKETVKKRSKKERINELVKQEQKIASTEDKFSIKKLISSSDKEDIDLGIKIVPYENRIVIPKIGQNIPLVDIKEVKVEGETQLSNIFMKELEDGVVRYPGSARPGEIGNSFIFGHSSNFPWISGEYNDVFSRLGQMNEGDVIFSYYGQKKYKYKITEKKVITPDDVSILKRNENKKELTLMTCWPIGTTLNRLILIGELIEEK